jgi:hypothetical protein
MHALRRSLLIELLLYQCMTLVVICHLFHIVESLLSTNDSSFLSTLHNIGFIYKLFAYKTLHKEIEVTHITHSKILFVSNK